MEIWDVYDENRIMKKHKIVRGEAIKAGDYHLVVHICIINSRREMLIQQRQPFKFGFSNRWDLTVGGSAAAGENSKQAAQRELLEELGLRVDFSEIRPAFTVNFPEGFDDYYLVNEDVDIEKLNLQEEEVKAVMWADQEKILQMIDSGEFIPYYKSLITMIFDMLNRYGSISDEDKGARE